MAPTDSLPDTADREIVVASLIPAPRHLVFEAYTEVRHLARWWGPEGFTTTTRSFEFREGGEWDFVMHGPDGTDYPNWIRWREIVPGERLVLDHGAGPDDPDAFRFPRRGRPGLRNDVRLAEGGPLVISRSRTLMLSRATTVHVRVRRLPTRA